MQRISQTHWTKNRLMKNKSICGGAGNNLSTIIEKSLDVSRNQTAMSSSRKSSEEKSRGRHHMRNSTFQQPILSKLVAVECA